MSTVGTDVLRGHGPGRTRTAAELRVLADEASERLSDASAEEVVAWAAATFGRSLAVACSMAGDTVVPHLVAQAAPGVDVLFLATGYHFPETLGTRDALVDVLPGRTVAEQDADLGPELYARDPAECCRLRKVEPIERELATYEAWVTGVRREDNPLRAGTRLVEWDARHEMVKVNPLAAWTFDNLLDYAGRHGVPVNLLLSDGYPSIGCAPCTRRVEPGQDPRAGRWAGLAKTECGLHSPNQTEEIA